MPQDPAQPYSKFPCEPVSDVFSALWATIHLAQTTQCLLGGDQRSPALLQHHAFDIRVSQNRVGWSGGGGLCASISSICLWWVRFLSTFRRLRRSLDPGLHPWRLRASVLRNQGEMGLSRVPGQACLGAAARQPDCYSLWI